MAAPTVMWCYYPQYQKPNRTQVIELVEQKVNEASTNPMFAGYAQMLICNTDHLSGNNVHITVHLKTQANIANKTHYTAHIPEDGSTPTINDRTSPDEPSEEEKKAWKNAKRRERREKRREKQEANLNASKI
jgi:hypothetical protein